MPLLFLGIQGAEWVLIILVVLLLFGATQIPKLARGLGRAQGEFKKARHEFEQEMQRGQGEAAAAVEERRVREAARDLGIDEEGKDLAEVKRLVNERLS